MARMQQKLSGVGKRLVSPGNGQNKWNYDQKLTLHLMFTEFELTLATATAVFNIIYADHLKSCGLPTGLQNNVISSQWGMSRKESPAKDWIIICSEATNEEEAIRRKRISNQISGTLGSLGAPTSKVVSYPVQPPPSPGAQPSSASKKRARAVSRIRSYMFESEVGTQPSAKKPKSFPSQVTVVVYRQEQDKALTSLNAGNKAVSRSSSKGPNSRRPDATVRYELPSGTVMWLTPQQFQETKGDLVPIDPNLAHPYVPLLFRYWTNECLSPMTQNGFTAGRFSSTIIPPSGPPSLQNFPWSCAAQHLNRDRKVASPFISTSNNFVWITRLALKEMKRGAVGGRISLINPAFLYHGAVFHAQPIHRELCKKRPFDNKAFMYHGMNEFLVWARIPREAIMHTFPVEMLLHLTNSNTGVAEILRLESLGLQNTGYHSTLLPAFKSDNIDIGKESIVAVAEVCKALGLDSSAVELVSSVVCDIVKGLGLVLEYKSKLEWRAAATIFSSVMCSPASSLALREGMSYAFLDGCRWGVGEFNARQKPKHMKTMLRRAQKIGLESPIEILNHDLDEAKAAIAKLEQKQRSLLRGASSQALLAEPNEDEEDSDDEIVVASRVTVRRRLFEQNKIHSDDDDDEDEDTGSVCEI